jgi:hypothetical protein
MRKPGAERALEGFKIARIQTVRANFQVGTKFRLFEFFSFLTWSSRCLCILLVRGWVRTMGGRSGDETIGRDEREEKHPSLSVGLFVVLSRRF